MAYKNYKIIGYWRSLACVRYLNVNTHNVTSRSVALIHFTVGSYPICSSVPVPMYVVCQIDCPASSRQLLGVRSMYVQSTSLSRLHITTWGERSPKAASSRCLPYLSCQRSLRITRAKIINRLTAMVISHRHRLSLPLCMCTLSVCSTYLYPDPVPYPSPLPEPEH
jgi:hypothetical protein